MNSNGHNHHNAAKIFVLSDDTGGQTRVIAEHTFPSDDYLQREIERRPDLIPGEQIDPEQPRRWLVVTRESGSTDYPIGIDRWTLDHLLVDQDAVPTLVECHMSTDVETGRLTIARLLDYAANIKSYWPDGRMREAARVTLRRAGRTYEYAVGELIESDDPRQVEAFWARADQNMSEGHVRIVLASSKFSPELYRMIEFFGGQLARTDLYGVEVKLFSGEALRVLSSRVVVRPPSGAARNIRRFSGPRRVTEDSLLATVANDGYRAFLNRLFLTCRQLGFIGEPGEAGFSWRARTPERPVVCWFFPPGRRGFAGLTDLTLGYDLTRESEVSPQTLDALRQFADRVRHVSVAVESRPWVNGARFGEETAPVAEGQLVEALTALSRSYAPAQV